MSIHQITLFASGKVLITRQYGKTLRKFTFHVSDPSKYAVKFYLMPYMQFAAGRGYTLFVKEMTPKNK